MKTLALVLQPVVKSYCREIREGVLQAAEQAGAVQVVELPFRASGAPPVRRGLESLDGVVAWVDRRHAWLQELSNTGVPVVSCGGDWEPSEGLAGVGVNMGSLLDLAVAHCRKLSIPRLKFFGQKVLTCGGRMKLVEALAGLVAPFGIETGFFELRGTPPNVSLSRLLTPQNEKAMLKWLLSQDLPLALFCENDHFARLACNVAKIAGMRIPDDLAVIGASDDVIGRLGEPTISTIRLPGLEVGERAFAIIRDSWSGKSMPTEPVTIPATDLIVRESTGGQSLDVVLERTRRQIVLEALTGLTMQELATGSGLSPKVLRRRYTEAFGESPCEHIKRLRLATAKRILMESDKSMADIAAACGFLSQAAFYNYFIRHEGVAPSDVRARGRTNG